ncbi:MAG: amino acid permease [Pseudomonadota bacterium]
MGHSLFAAKPIHLFEEEMKDDNRLRRVLGPISLTSLGVGAIIGAGIFVLTGMGARDHAGPALTLSFVVAGMGCAFTALCYAEFASMLPVAGSAYTYAYATLGEFVAWIIGWDLIIEYSMASAAVAVGWSGYLLKLLALFHIKLPFWLANDYFTAKAMLASNSPLLAGFSDLTIPTVLGIPVAFNLPAMLVILVITAILVKGIRESAGFNATMVAIKLVVVLFVIFVGSFYVDTKNWTPFMPMGWMGMFAGAGYIFFAYIGFDSVSTHAEEAINPRRDVPIGIIASLAICTVLYIAVAAVMTGMEHYSRIDISAPIASAFVAKGLSVAVFIISIAAVAGITSVLLVLMLSQPRVFLAMARDGLLPRSVFGTVHPRFRTPHRATMLMGAVVSLVAALTPIEDIAKLVNIGTLLAFVIVCAAVWVMRHTHPERPRPFRCPWVPVVPLLGIVFCLGLMFFLGWVNWLRLFVWLAIGVVIYFAYGRRHSVLAQPRATTTTVVAAADQPRTLP